MTPKKATGLRTHCGSQASTRESIVPTCAFNSPDARGFWCFQQMQQRHARPAFRRTNKSHGMPQRPNVKNVAIKCDRLSIPRLVKRLICSHRSQNKLVYWRIMLRGESHCRPAVTVLFFLAGKRVHLKTKLEKFDGTGCGVVDGRKRRVGLPHQNRTEPPL